MRWPPYFSIDDLPDQELVLQVHLHVIPRFADEPLAGKGIRYFMKQAQNRRPGF